MNLDAVPKTPAPYTVYQASEWGYSTIKIANATHLTMRLFADDTNDEHYSFSITRAYPRTP
jgi:hypothetical protein